jgi:hypothetical protein
MIILSERCKKCNSTCNAIYFQQNFENWTSGSYDIDKFIQNTQLSAHDNAEEALEWIPYDRLYNVKYIEKTGTYKANWFDGYIYQWNYESQNWRRFNQNMLVVLKCLNISKSITLEFINEVY